MSKALIIVIIPYNDQAQNSAEVWQSVREQTYENWECIIENDGSTNNN